MDEPRKTWKREVAGGLLAFWAGLVCWAVYKESVLTVDLVKFSALPIFTFAFAAFGVDALAKQILPAWRS